MKTYNLSPKQLYNFEHGTNDFKDRFIKQIFGISNYESYDIIKQSNLSKHGILIVKGLK